MLENSVTEVFSRNHGCLAIDLNMQSFKVGLFQISCVFVWTFVNDVIMNNYTHWSPMERLKF